MDMSWKNCWDCPLPVWTVLIQFALLFLSGAVGTWMLGTRKPGVREIGAIMVTLTVLWAAAITRAVPRWGILRDDIPFDVLAQRTTYAIFGVLDLVLIGVISVVWRFTSRPATRA